MIATNYDNLPSDIQTLACGAFNNLDDTSDDPNLTQWVQNGNCCTEEPQAFITAPEGCEDSVLNDYPQWAQDAVCESVCPAYLAGETEYELVLSDGIYYIGGFGPSVTDELCGCCPGNIGESKQTLSENINDLVKVGVVLPGSFKQSPSKEPTDKDKPKEKLKENLKKIKRIRKIIREQAGSDSPWEGKVCCDVNSTNYGYNAAGQSQNIAGSVDTYVMINGPEGDSCAQVICDLDFGLDSGEFQGMALQPGKDKPIWPPKEKIPVRENQKTIKRIKRILRNRNK